MHVGPQFIGMPLGRIESDTSELPVERRSIYNNRPNFYQENGQQHRIAIRPLKGIPKDENRPNANFIAAMNWEPKDSTFMKEQEPNDPWPVKAGEINDIWTRDDHRRKGLATFMYGYAKKMSESDPTVAPPVHSTHLSDAGEKWAKSTGDPVPKRKYKNY